jgi:hypothetical protein
VGDELLAGTSGADGAKELKMKTKWFLFTLIMANGILSAQFGDSRRASMTGSRGNTGKCTVEIVVDGAAEVEIYGDMGRIRNLSGQRASWRRLECSDPLPRNPTDFRFQGVDGRGDARLVRDPRQNRGTAVVRIEDPKGGSEGYTFDIEWSGTSGSYSDGRPDRRDDRYDRRDDRYERRDDRNDRRDDDRYDRRRDRRDGSYTITCEADGNRRRYCEADTNGGVRLRRELGGSCREGVNWGYDRRGIWVDRGCRAEFEVGR